MTPKKKTDTTPPPDLFRLAEIIHIRRVDQYAMSSTYYFECRLCLGRSAAGGEIGHRQDCPVLRLRR